TADDAAQQRDPSRPQCSPRAPVRSEPEGLAIDELAEARASRRSLTRADLAGSIRAQELALATNAVELARGPARQRERAGDRGSWRGDGRPLAARARGGGSEHPPDRRTTGVPRGVPMSGGLGRPRSV